MLEDSDGKHFMFEVYSENDGPVKGCKTDSKGTVVQGKHKTYRSVLLFSPLKCFSGLLFLPFSSIYLLLSSSAFFVFGLIISIYI